MTLEQLYKYLTQFPKTRTCKHGFTNPHSYRGYYEELAFEPAENVTVGHMIMCCTRAHNETFTGWKGGEFTYSDNTYVHIAYEGNANGENDDFPSEILLSIAGVK